MDLMANVPSTLSDLILSLEQATFMAKQLPSSADHTHLLQIYTSLHTAHHNLSNFLSQIDFPPRPSPPPPPPATETSFSSATAANENEPMEVGDNHDEVEAEEEISKVQEKMRECFIKNKRPKRPLSPAAAAAEERQFGGDDDGFVGRLRDFDPNATKLKALDLVYQFHG